MNSNMAIVGNGSLAYSMRKAWEDKELQRIDFLFGCSRVKKKNRKIIKIQLFNKKFVSQPMELNFLIQ